MSYKKPHKPKDVYRIIYRPILDMFAPRMSRKLERIIEELTESEESFGKKIDEAYESLQNTSALIAQIERELDRKIEGVENLKQEYERYRQLAEVEEERAQALIEQLDTSLDRNKGKERLIGFVISVIAGLVIFFFGVLVGPYL